jgi:dTDP-4-dehydrorhamnose 3,5-epimerase
MIEISDASISDVKVITSTPYQDHRGAFARWYCTDELAEVLQQRTIRQINFSETLTVGAIRGLHFQSFPSAEMKIVRCIKGRVFDVAVDIRANSRTFLKWMAIELSEANHRAIMIPEGFAHGFQVLETDSKLLYLHTALYDPKAEGGVRYNDPEVGINWPLDPSDLSARDLSHRLIDKNFEGIRV